MDLLDELLRICGFGLNENLPEYRMATIRLHRELSNEYRAGFDDGRERANELHGDQL